MYSTVGLMSSTAVWIMSMNSGVDFVYRRPIIIIKDIGYLEHYGRDRLQYGGHKILWMIEPAATCVFFLFSSRSSSAASGMFSSF